MAVEYLGDKLLFLDLSSTCTGYVVTDFNKDKSEAEILDCGAFWYEADITHGLKYYTICKFILELCKKYHICGIVLEGYFINPYKTGGCSVVPELQGAVKAFVYTLSLIPSCSIFPPQSWRSSCKIKKDATKTGGAAWKEVTKKRIEEILNIKFPEKVISNVTEKNRKFPYDISDSLGICIGWLKASPNYCTKFIINKWRN